MQLPPPQPHWPWFAAVAGLALLASLTIASGRDPRAPQPALAAGPSQVAASAASSVSQDASPAFDRRYLLCSPSLN